MSQIFSNNSWLIKQFNLILHEITWFCMYCVFIYLCLLYELLYMLYSVSPLCFFNVLIDHQLFVSILHPSKFWYRTYNIIILWAEEKGLLIFIEAWPSSPRKANVQAVHVSWRERDLTKDEQGYEMMTQMLPNMTLMRTLPFVSWQ